jgi:Periplasmic copper-binding protein (NosD)
MYLTRKLMTIHNASLLLAVISITLLWASVAEAGTRITQATCPIVIAQSGEYSLATDVGPCAGDGIDIVASDVKLQMGGHSITGNATCSGGAGIRVGFAPAVTDVSVQGNGTISGFYVGFWARNSSDSSVKNVTVTAACPFFSYGFVLQLPGSGWQLQGNVVREPGPTSTGIYVIGVGGNDVVRNDVNDTIQFTDSNNNTIVNNTASNNEGGLIIATFVTGSHNNEIHANRTNNNSSGDGLQVQHGSTGNNLSGNKSFGNLPFDMEDDNPNCDSNSWQGNQFNTANQPCIQ